MALKADMPDFVDSGGPKNLGTGFLKNDMLPLAVGVGAAGLSVVVGLGLVNVAKPYVSQVPVLGQVIQSGANSEVPTGWEGV